MLFIENVLLALNGLWSNKMRSLLTMLGIIIGIGSVIAIMTVGDSLSLSVSEQMQTMGANNIQVVLSEKDSSMMDSLIGISSGSQVPDENDYFTKEMIENVVNTFGDKIEAVSVVEQYVNGTMKYTSKEAPISLAGANNGYLLSENLQMVAGRRFTEQDLNDGKKVCIIADQAAEKIYGKDNFEQVLGKTVEILQDDVTVEYTVIGIYENPNAGMMAFMSSMPTYVFIPIKTAKSFTHVDGYQYFSIITKIGIDSTEFANEIERFFEGYYRNNPDFEVTAFSMTAMISSMTDMLGKITTAISVVASIALLVGGIGVMNIMLVSVTERTREIGTRKALGATNSSIRTQFIIEAVVICIVGGIIGIILGLTMGNFASKLLGYPAQPSIRSIVISLSFSTAIGIFFGYYPANKAAKMNPIDALRYE